jgi:hypothetical protein
MTVLIIVGALALVVLLGSTILIWGGKHLGLSSRVVAITFAVTALSWVAFVITTISITIRTLVLPTA